MIKTQSLMPDILNIVLDKGTEIPGSGEYCNSDDIGTYLCRKCGIALFRSSNKFLSSCGWPSFDDELAGKVLRKLDQDGKRTEILCDRCHAHLGHIFIGEQQTTKNNRYCVNSLSIDFVKNKSTYDTNEIFLAGGCFWGVEYHLKKHVGVLKVESGYMGGDKKHPTYDEVCYGNTGYLECVRVIYDCNVDLETILKLFFNIHDPTQVDGQGGDIGDQYQSAIFYYDKYQKALSIQLLNSLIDGGLKIATRVEKASIFWPAEDYHQNYYSKNNGKPYCHNYVQRL